MEPPPAPTWHELFASDGIPHQTNKDVEKYGTATISGRNRRLPFASSIRLNGTRGTIALQVGFEIDDDVVQQTRGERVRHPLRQNPVAGDLAFTLVETCICDHRCTLQQTDAKGPQIVSLESSDHSSWFTARKYCRLAFVSQQVWRRAKKGLSIWGPWWRLNAEAARSRRCQNGTPASCSVSLVPALAYVNPA
jgi:hypothetical protein